MCCRTSGPRLVMKPALGMPGTGTVRISAISVAWRTVAGWLVGVQAGFTARAPTHACNRAKRCRWQLAHYDWSHLGRGKHAAALRQWVWQITPAVLADRLQLNWFRATAAVIAARAEAYDIQKAQLAWTSWLLDGPSKCLRRLHAMTRIDTGWIPSAVCQSPGVEDTNELHEEAWLDLEPAVTDEVVQQSECVPLGREWTCKPNCGEQSGLLLVRCQGCHGLL